MRWFFVKIIELYQKTPTRAHYSCRFIPTCSEYTKEAIIKYGVIKGLYLGFGRVLRCNPFQKSKYDPLR